MVVVRDECGFREGGRIRRNTLVLGHKKRQFLLAVQAWMLACKSDAIFAECGGGMLSKGLTSIRRWCFVYHRFKTA